MTPLVIAQWLANNPSTQKSFIAPTLVLLIFLVIQKRERGKDRAAEKREVRLILLPLMMHLIYSSTVNFTGPLKHYNPGTASNSSEYYLTREWWRFYIKAEKIRVQGLS